MSKTTLVLTNKEATGLLPMKECIQLLHEAYADFGSRNAQVLPRRRIHTPLKGFPEPRWGWMNVIPGVVPCHGVAAIRLDCAHMTFPLKGGQKRMDFPGDREGDGHDRTAHLCSRQATAALVPAPGGAYRRRAKSPAAPPPRRSTCRRSPATPP